MIKFAISIHSKTVCKQFIFGKNETISLCYFVSQWYNVQSSFHIHMSIFLSCHYFHFDAEPQIHYFHSLETRIFSFCCIFTFLCVGIFFSVLKRKKYEVVDNKNDLGMCWTKRFQMQESTTRFKFCFCLTHTTCTCTLKLHCYI